MTEKILEIIGALRTKNSHQGLSDGDFDSATAEILQAIVSDGKKRRTKEYERVEKAYVKEMQEKDDLNSIHIK